MQKYIYYVYNIYTYLQCCVCTAQLHGVIVKVAQGLLGVTLRPPPRAVSPGTDPEGDKAPALQRSPGVDQGLNTSSKLQRASISIPISIAIYICMYIYIYGYLCLLP